MTPSVPPNREVGEEGEVEVVEAEAIDDEDDEDETVTASASVVDAIVIADGGGGVNPHRVYTLRRANQRGANDGVGRW